MSCVSWPTDMGNVNQPQTLVHYINLPWKVNFEVFGDQLWVSSEEVFGFKLQFMTPE